MTIESASAASKPGAVPARASTLTAVAEGVWIAQAQVRFLGLRLSSTMTVLRLGDGSVLVHSPVPLSDDHRAALKELGGVTHLYAPNLFHHLHLGSWAAAFPDARVHAPAGLSKKRPDLRIDRALDGDPESGFEGVVDELGIEGFRLDETVLFHRSSRTLIVADLVHNIGQPTHGWTKLYTRAMGFYDRVALSRMVRWTGVSDRSKMHSSVERLLALPFERLIVGHGAPLENARQTLADACSWLG
jgi:hypothetical protein